MKVLALDGGGIRGIFTAYVLHLIEKTLGEPLCKKFDMLAGTSTGAIIAAAVACSIPMRDVVNLYFSFGQEVFKRRSRFGLMGTIYEDEALRDKLYAVFGDVRLKDIEMRLLIPSVQLLEGKPYLFRSRYKDDAEAAKDDEIQLIDAIVSSCAAPLYFPPHHIARHFTAADGGLWANNPSLVCLTELISHYPLDQIHILSVGSGLQKIRFPHGQEHQWSVLDWIKVKYLPFRIIPKILDLALHLTSESISNHCQKLCRERYLRINEDLQQEIPFDDVRHSPTLVRLAKTAFEKHRIAIERFLPGET